jgi:hypothetical protein
MSQPNTQPIGRFIPTVKTLMVLLSLSFGVAIYLVNSGAFWHFVSWLPRTLTEGLIGFLHTVTSPIQPVEVHAQEEQLEFFTAWSFSGVALVTAYLLFIAMRAAFRARKSNAP